MADKDLLLERIREGRKVQALINQSGWEIIRGKLEEWRQDATHTLSDPEKDSERHDARAMLRMTRQLLDWIDYTVKDVDAAKADYMEQYGDLPGS